MHLMIRVIGIATIFIFNKRKQSTRRGARCRDVASDETSKASHIQLVPVPQVLSVAGFLETVGKVKEKPKPNA